MTKNKSKEAHKLREEIIEIGRKVNTSPYEWGERYKKIRDKKLWKDYGCKSFTEFCADPDLPLAISTVWAYIKVYEIVGELKINPTILERLPIYKFRMIMPKLKEENKDELIHQALTLSGRDLSCALGEEDKSKGFKDRKPLPAVWRCKHCGKFVWDAVPEEICMGH